MDCSGRDGSWEDWKEEDNGIQIIAVVGDFHFICGSAPRRRLFVTSKTPSVPLFVQLRHTFLALVDDKFCMDRQMLMCKVQLVS